MTFLARVGLLALPLVIACGGQIDTGHDGGADGGQPPPISDAQPPPSDASPPPPVLDGGQCNDLLVMGSLISLQQVPSNPPTFPAGGAPIAPGGYVLNAFTAYTGPNGSSTSLGQGQVTLRISGASVGFDVQAVAVIDNQAPTRSGSTLAVAGSNKLTLAAYCPQSTSVTPASYYFDGMMLSLRVDSGGGQVIDEQFMLVAP